MRSKAMMMAAAMMGGLGMTDESLNASRFHDDGKPPKQIIPKGMKEFVIDGQTYYAINYKNALRKHKKFNTLT